MKRKGRKAVMIAIYIISALLLLFFIWCIMSPGRIRTYDGKKSLSEKFVMDINGSPNGFFINSQDTDNPVLLFVGTDEIFYPDVTKFFHMLDTDVSNELIVGEGMNHVYPIFPIEESGPACRKVYHNVMR